MKINYSFYIIFIGMIILGVGKEISYFIIALMCHEIGHIFVIKIFRIKIKKITLSFFGGEIQIKRNEIASYKYLLVYLSGIVTNIMLYFLINNSVFKKCNIILFLFNSLPIYPLDGYRILKEIISLHFLQNKPYKTLKLLHRISYITICGLIMFGIYTTSLGILIISATLIFKNMEYNKNFQKIALYELVQINKTMYN